MDFALAYIHFVDVCIDFVDVRDDFAMAAIDFGMVIPDFSVTHVDFFHVQNPLFGEDLKGGNYIGAYKTDAACFGAIAAFPAPLRITLLAFWYAS
ncbi:MAG: hypothetical protein H7329_00520 [Opitutaceae bacterium]|nr:hypothetical protein [Cytophagales bacterium]